MELDYHAFYHAQMERYAYFSVACFLGYEYLLQLSNEIDLFWRKRWSFGKALFLWSRYYSLGFNIVNAIMFMNTHPSLDFCTRFFRWQNTGAALQIITTHIILELRIYAMYNSQWWIFWLCCFLTASEATVYGVIFGLNRPGLVSTNNPSLGLYICADGDPPNAHWITWFWLTIICIESVLLCLSLYKGWVSYRAGFGGGLMMALTRDSVLYFIVIFLIYVANMSLWFVNIVTLDEFGTGFSFTISAVLANRLLISVREKYYEAHSELRSWDTYSSMHFRGQPGVPTEVTDAPEGSTTWAIGTRSRWDIRTDRTDVQEIEMDNFSETRGF